MPALGVFVVGRLLLEATVVVAATEADPFPEGELPSVVTIDQAIAAFRSRGFDLLLAEAATDSARADALIASSIPNPAVNGALSKTFYTPDPNACAGCASIGFSLGLSDSAAIADTLSGKRSLRMTVGNAAYEAAKLSRKDAQRQLELALKQAYLQTALAKRILAFSRDVQKTNVDTLALNQIRYKAGAISEADLAKIETAKLEADQAVDATSFALRQNQVLLGFLLGSRKSTPEFDIDDAILHAPVPAQIANATRDSLIEIAFRNRPDLGASKHQVERAEGSISLAKRLRFPDISISAQYTQEGTGSNALTPPTLTFGLGAPIPVLYQLQGEIAKAEADLRTQQIIGTKIEAQIVSDVETAFASMTASHKLVDRMESTLLERSTRVRDLVNIQYQKGAASLLEYLDAQRTFVATQVEYLQNLTTYRLALFQLEQALGGSIEP